MKNPVLGILNLKSDAVSCELCLCSCGLRGLGCEPTEGGGGVKKGMQGPGHTGGNADGGSIAMLWLRVTTPLTCLLLQL